MPNFLNKYPYTDFHELNLDWILEMTKNMQITINEFVHMNTIKYADPINWNITSSYEESTIVINASDNVAYLSKTAVPAGINITDSTYWLPIFDMNELLKSLYIIPQMFGAVGDGINDDYDAIMKAYEYCDSNDKILMFPKCTGYYCSDTLIFDKNVEFHMLGSILTDANIGLIVGDHPTRNEQNRYTVRIANISPLRDLKTGVIIYNAYYSAINIENVSEFENGVKLIADTVGFSYNTINIGAITNCKTGLELSTLNNGWINENMFQGGTIRVAAGDSYLASSIGIHIVGTSLHYSNANYFIKPCLEGLNTCIKLEYASNNTFEAVRVEGAGTAADISGGNSSLNAITCTGSNTINFNDASSNARNIIQIQNNPLNRMYPVYVNPSIANTCCSNATEISSGDILCKLNIVDMKTGIRLARCYKTLDGLVFTGTETLGFFVDTTNAKSFYIGASDHNVRRICVCYDVNNDLITDNEGTVFGAYYGNVQANTPCWIIGSSSTAGRTFTVPDSCVKMFVGYAGLSTINQISLYSLTADAIVIPNRISRGLSSIPTCDSLTGDTCVDNSGNTHGWIYYSNAWHALT